MLSFPRRNPRPSRLPALLLLLLAWPAGAVEFQLLEPAEARWKGAFGLALDFEKDILVVGEPHVCGGGGLVHLYQRRGCDWVLLETIAPPSGELPGEFGAAVDLLGDLLVVGSPERRAPGDPTRLSGSADVFRRGPDGWSHEAELRAAIPEDQARFGHRVALTLGAGGEAIVAVTARHEQGQVGAVHVFSDRSGTWQREAHLVGPGSPVLYFGTALAFQGERLLIGQHHTCCDIQPVLAFVRSGGDWVPEQEIRPDASMSAWRFPAFGTGIAAENRIVAVGAPGDAGPDATRGAVRVFDVDELGSIETGRARASVAGSEDGTGQAIDLDDGVLVAALRETFGTPVARPAVAWTRVGETWVESAILGPDGDADAAWGHAVATNGRFVAVGAPQASPSAYWSGTVHVYDLEDRDGDCEPDHVPTCTEPPARLTVRRSGDKALPRWEGFRSDDLLLVGPLPSAGVSPLHRMQPLGCGASAEGRSVPLEGSLALLVSRPCVDGTRTAGSDSLGWPRWAGEGCP